MLLNEVVVEALINYCAKKLDLPKKVVDDAVKKLKELPRNVPFSYLTIAGGLVYVYSKNKKPVTQKQISEVLKVTQPSIGKVVSWILGKRKIEEKELNIYLIRILKDKEMFIDDIIKKVREDLPNLENELGEKYDGSLRNFISTRLYLLSQRGKIISLGNGKYKC
jgi:transcription initiation factor TFIIIB Brf1 subunit/transcription initiation factor TFIIB